MPITFTAVGRIGTRKNKSKTYPINIRVTQSRKSIYLPIGRKIEDQYWSGKEGVWVKISHPLAFEINDIINRKIGELRKYEVDQERFGNNCTLETIKKFYEKRGNRSSFHDFALDYVNNIQGKSANTVKLYRTFLKHLNEFSPELPFKRLTESFLLDFANWMHHDKGLAGVSTNKYIKPFKIISKQAVKEGYIERDPFFAVKITDAVPNTKAKDRVYLEIHEIQQLKNAKIPSDRFDLRETRDRWLMCFYAGFYYSDLNELKWSTIKNTDLGYCIMGERFKNKKNFISPIHKFKHAVEIIELQKGQDDEYVFPNLIAEQKFNEKLKELASLAGIDKNLMNKTARHSFIQFWAAKGLQTQQLMKMVGHSRESTTKVYFELSVNDINNQVSNFDLSNLDI